MDKFQSNENDSSFIAAAGTHAPTETPVQADTDSSRKTRRPVTLGLSLILLVGVVGIAVFVAPRIIHTNHISQYTKILAETDEALTQTAKDKAREAAARELLQLQEDGAQKFLARLNEVAATEAPILSAETTTALTKAAEQLSTSLGSSVPAESELAKLPLAIAIEEQGASSVLDLSVDQAVKLLNLQTTAVTSSAVAGENVNGDVVARAREHRDAALAAAQAQSRALAKVQNELDAIQANLGGTVQPLLAAAHEAPAQVTKVISEAGRSNAEKQNDATQKANAASDATVGSTSQSPRADAESGVKQMTDQTPVGLLSLVHDYVVAAKAVTAHHAAVIAEEAAAAAAASGADGYADPSTGSWVATDQGGSWGSGGSGGGNSGGGSSGGGSGGGNAGTPASWFAANCPHGYNWWWSPANGGEGYCLNAPEIGDDW